MKSKLQIHDGCDKNAANLISIDREGGGSSISLAQHRRQLQQSRQGHSQARRRRFARFHFQRHRRRFQQLRWFGSFLFFISTLHYLFIN